MNSIFNNYDKNDIIKLFPNPVQNTFYIKYNSQKIQKSSIVNIYSIEGIKVLETIIEEEIDVSGLASGVYFVSIDGIRMGFVKM